MKRSMNKLTIASTVSAALLIGTGVNTASADPHGYKAMMIYHVTITNTTTNHVITPPIVIAHRKGFQIFHLGDAEKPASYGLAMLAETGSPTELADMLSNNDKVTDIEIGSFIKPGIPYTVEIIAPRNTLFTVAGMLATTNDAFTSAMNMKAPRKGRYHHAMGITYDAGSEANNESCAFIPGPPCAPDSGNDNEPGEGMVTVHSGVYGKADLVAADLDWRGPTSMITIHNAGRYRGE